MKLMTANLADEMAALVTGRNHDLFMPDMRSRHAELEDRIEGKRVLVVGGAGSIGAATVRQLLSFHPHALHVIDINENRLAELVRDLRSRANGLAVSDFRTLPLDFGSVVMQRFMREVPRYDLVFNFAALKHVRSEKDVCSLLQLIDTNVLKAARFMHWLSQSDYPCRYFCVSTDKAANPVSLMGASKRIMEHLIFSREVSTNANLHVTTARFPNVAFSDGSLLHGFLNRMQKMQPLALPKDAQRYFISPKESGQICLLAAVCGYDRHVIIPRLDFAHDSIDLLSVAAATLRSYGLEPSIYEDEDEARSSVAGDVRAGKYSVLLSPLDTSGEKRSEEFLADGEEAIEIGLSTLLGVNNPSAPFSVLSAFLKSAEDILTSPEAAVTKTEIAELMSTVVPELRHNDTGRNLDERM